MPKPGDGESREDFMSRCIPQVLEDGSAESQDQAVAICNSLWENKSFACGMLTIKAIDDDQRIVEGIATTPEPDRVGDIVEPMGVKFKNPLPLLWQHRSAEPIGQARFKKPTKDGVEFTATLPRVTEPGRLKDRVDEAWQSLKHGLVRGVSIGFKAIEASFMDDGGIRFIQTEVLELSLVTIPANSEATITAIKSIDAQSRAATGPTLAKPPGVTGSMTSSGSTMTLTETSVTIAGSVKTLAKKSTVVKAKEAKQMSKKTIAEQISAFEATRASKDARMNEIMDAAAEKGETLDAAQKEEYDTLATEVKEIDEHLVRLRAREAANKAAAVVVTPPSVTDPRGGAEPIRVSTRRNVEPGIMFVRCLGAKYLANRFHVSAVDIAKSKFGDTPEVEMVLRTAVTAGTTTGTTWAEPLVQAQNMASEFVDLIAPNTIIGRIPGLRRVPFNIKIPRETTGASVNWVGENRIKPVSEMAFDSITLAWNKVAGIVPITQELMMFSNPAAEGLVRDSLVRAVAYLTDRDFLDPTKAVATGVSPASVTNGVTPITASGTTSAALIADLGDLVAAFTALNMGTSGLVFVMTDTQAFRIGTMQNALGQTIFPAVGATGGTLWGFPVITSENMVATGSSPVDGGMIVAIRAQDVLVADDGGVQIDISTEASIQMDTTPDSPATASTITVSAFQYNMVLIRAERFITWLKRRTGAVQFIQYAKYE